MELLNSFVWLEQWLGYDGVQAFDFIAGAVSLAIVLALYRAATKPAQKETC